MKAVITIAGFGTRFLPATKAVPKEMFPIAGVPLLQHHVEGLVAAGIHEVIVVGRDGSDVAQRHFSPNPALEAQLAKAGKEVLVEEVRRISCMADIVFVRQPETLPYGNASPALAARPWLTPGEPFYYMFGDDIILADRPVPLQMVDAFDSQHPAALLAAQAVPAEETRLYGCVDFVPGAERRVRRIVEKPAPGTAPSNWVLVGHYIFTPEIYDVLTGSEVGKAGELWLADAVDRLAARSAVLVHPIQGEWMAAGDPLRYIKANIAMALRHPGMRDDLLAFMRTLDR
ncbi:MAG TPA: UTP--glucose-1-phosphate uridylyltransferase [Anaerolineae bacterium]|nr:UTP--glucose-1-phosphate uridylyltransferase [Anaerolineae bacterium]